MTGAAAEHSAASPQGPLVIEFLGLPGAGKTTAAALLRRSLAEDGIATVFAPEITRDDLPDRPRFLARAALILRALPHWRRDLPLLGAILAIRQRRFRDRLKAIYNGWTLLSLHARLPGSAIAVLDQGLMQAIWSFHLFSPDEPDITRWVTRLGARLRGDHLVIYLSQPASLCRERLEMRESRHSRLQDRAIAQDQALWQRAERICEDIARATPGTITIEAGKDGPAGIVARVLEAVEAHPAFAAHRAAAAPTASNGNRST